VAEAVFAGEKIEKFPADDSATPLALLFAPVAGLGEDFLEDEGADDAGDGDGEDEELNDLAGEVHCVLVYEAGFGFGDGESRKRNRAAGDF
jgi:hypothetical protein